MLAFMNYWKRVRPLWLYPDRGNIVRFPATDRNPQSGGEIEEKADAILHNDAFVTPNALCNVLIIFNTDRALPWIGFSPCGNLVNNPLRIDLQILQDIDGLPEPLACRQLP
jgi:hypothetical protein